MKKSKPPVSLWIAAERKRHGWKTGDLALRLQTAGYEAAETTVRTWEAGRSPRPETVTGLERLFGSQAPVEREVEVGSIVGVLKEIVAELARIREAQEETAMTLGYVVGVAERLVPGGLSGALADEVHDGTPK